MTCFCEDIVPITPQINHYLGFVTEHVDIVVVSLHLRQKRVGELIYISCSFFLVLLFFTNNFKLSL